MAHRPLSPPKATSSHPFRRAVLRGLGVLMPPLLTIVFFLWIWNSVQAYVIYPLEALTKHVLVSQISDVYDEVPLVPGQDLETDKQGAVVAFRKGEKKYVSLPSGQWIPRGVAELVRRSPGDENPETAEAVYERYVEIRWLRPAVVVPIFFSVFIILIYLLGKFIAARVGSLVWTSFERLIDHLPFIRTVYGTVKQVTDIIFSDEEIEYARVVAIEYPRKGIWSIGFVTGESMSSVRSVAGEPVLSVLMPTSPMPATGFTISIRKSETIDLDLSVDQAFQFIVSCGVVVPHPEKLSDPAMAQRVQTAILDKSASSPALRDG